MAAGLPPGTCRRRARAPGSPASKADAARRRAARRASRRRRSRRPLDATCGSLAGTCGRRARRRRNPPGSPTRRDAHRCPGSLVERHAESTYRVARAPGRALREVADDRPLGEVARPGSRVRHQLELDQPPAVEKRDVPPVTFTEMCVAARAQDLEPTTMRRIDEPRRCEQPARLRETKAAPVCDSDLERQRREGDRRKGSEIGDAFEYGDRRRQSEHTGEVVPVVGPDPAGRERDLEHQRRHERGVQAHDRRWTRRRADPVGGGRAGHAPISCRSLARGSWTTRSSCGPSSWASR